MAPSRLSCTHIIEEIQVLVPSHLFPPDNDHNNDFHSLTFACPGWQARELIYLNIPLKCCAWDISWIISLFLNQLPPLIGERKLANSWRNLWVQFYFPVFSQFWIFLHLFVWKISLKKCLFVDPVPGKDMCFCENVGMHVKRVGWPWNMSLAWLCSLNQCLKRLLLYLGKIWSSIGTIIIL